MKSIAYDIPIQLDPMDFGEDRHGQVCSSGGVPHGMSSG